MFPSCPALPVTPSLTPIPTHHYLFTYYHTSLPPSFCYSTISVIFIFISLVSHHHPSPPIHPSPQFITLSSRYSCISVTCSLSPLSFLFPIFTRHYPSLPITKTHHHAFLTPSFLVLVIHLCCSFTITVFLLTHYYLSCYPSPQIATHHHTSLPLPCSCY